MNGKATASQASGLRTNSALDCIRKILPHLRLLRCRVLSNMLQVVQKANLVSSEQTACVLGPARCQVILVCLGMRIRMVLMSLLPIHFTVYLCASAPGIPACATLTRFVATVATAVATAVATGPICVATAATAKKR